MGYFLYDRTDRRLSALPPWTGRQRAADGTGSAKGGSHTWRSIGDWFWRNGAPGERGKFIDVLTEHNTVREIYVRGAKKNTSAGLSATQLFSYANFSIRKQQKGLYLDSAEPIRIFYRLRESLSRLSLAMYFSELVRLTSGNITTRKETCL